MSRRSLQMDSCGTQLGGMSRGVGAAVAPTAPAARGSAPSASLCCAAITAEGVPTRAVVGEGAGPALPSVGRSAAVLGAGSRLERCCGATVSLGEREAGWDESASWRVGEYTLRRGVPAARCCSASPPGGTTLEALLAALGSPLGPLQALPGVPAAGPQLPEGPPSRAWVREEAVPPALSLWGERLDRPRAGRAEAELSSASEALLQCRLS